MAAELTNRACVVNSSQRKQMHLWLLEPVHTASGLRRSAVLEVDDVEPYKVWFEIPEDISGYTTESIEPFLIAVLFRAMEVGGHLKVHGSVSKQLLQNLAEFQLGWRNWFPERYEFVEISGEGETAGRLNQSSKRAIAAYTGGVDSSYTMLRHHRLVSGAEKRNIEAGLMMHGFDIPLELEESFQKAAAVGTKVLKSLGVDLYTIRCNLFNPHWEQTHGAALAACLSLFQNRFDEGLIASSYTYTQFHGAWGSNPITDHLLSSASFPITHDGSGFYRSEKLDALATWEEAYNNLRVCFSCEERSQNCGVCPKCVQTLVICRAGGLPLAKSFPRDVTVADIVALNKLGPDICWAFNDTAARLKKRNLPQSDWLDAFYRCAAFNQKRRQLLQPRSGWKEELRKLELLAHERVGI